MRDASDDGGSAARAQPPRPSRTIPAGADFALCKGKRLCYSRTLARVVPGSSAVEQPAVNRLVDGSNPSRGAILLRDRDRTGLSEFQSSFRAIAAVTR